MRRYRILNFGLILIILFSSFMGIRDIGFAAISEEEVKAVAYERGYDAGKDVALKNNADKKYYIYDYITKPDRNKVINENGDFLINVGNSSLLRNLFYNSYMEGFEWGYKDYIGTTNTGGSTGTEKKEEHSVEFGTFFGLIYGEIEGFKDYEAGKSLNSSRSLPKDSEITSIFDLSNIPSIDKNKFVKEFKANYKIGYEEAYYKGKFGVKRDSMEAGKEDGALFGSMLGNLFGNKDYYEGRDSNYNRNMPSDSKITTDYLLNRDNADYLKGFVDGFKNAYKESYISSFREANKNTKLLEDLYAYENGYEVGQAKGKIQGNIDYMEKKTNDWVRSQPLSSTINMEYNLIYQTYKYREGFVNGYWDGYAKGYTDTYKENSQQTAMNKTTSTTVPIKGGVFPSLDNGMIVEIDKGIYFNPVILTIDTLNSSYVVSDRYFVASSFYRLAITNPSENFNRDKKIKISFEYYGDKNGGIYKLEGDKWKYMPSTVEENKVSTYTNPSTINSNVFAVLIDTKSEVLYDIRGHWAKDEITTHIRRDTINGYPDKTFRPEQYITRGEFLVLLSRVYNWSLPTNLSNLATFKDRGAIASYNERQISYGLTHGYILGYGDGNFKPNNNISYKEVETIMRRVLNDPKFNWNTYAQKMIYEKKIRSASLDSMDNKISRAEFSYLLYELTKWDY